MVFPAVRAVGEMMLGCFLEGLQIGTLGGFLG
jgi:hypothetical protein